MVCAMISCTACKNSRYCPLWKSEKINMRIMREHETPINYCLEMVRLLNIGEDYAQNCKKFQKYI